MKSIMNIEGYSTKVAIHGAHHEFGPLGKLAHIQLNMGEFSQWAKFMMSTMNSYLCRIAFNIHDAFHECGTLQTLSHIQINMRKFSQWIKFMMSTMNSYLCRIAFKLQDAC